MLRIRLEQLEAFSTNQEDNFAERVVRFLQLQFPDAAQEDSSKLLTVVKRQIFKAESYGIEFEQDLAIYTTAAWLLGPDFDTEFPAAFAVLSSPKMQGQKKAAWLRDFATELFSRLLGADR